ncbi:MAG: pseudouridine synthase [Bacillota bacterium]|jgi:23S rRNA pseudouridine2605 synthase
MQRDNNDNHYERLQKTISRLGIASRRTAEQMILDGRVRVNGRVVSQLGTKIDPQKDNIYVDNVLYNTRPPLQYILLYKPAGWICSLNDEKGRRTVIDLLEGITDRVYPVGRLDYATSGVLLLTNDGQLANNLLHPSKEVRKTYLVELLGQPTKEQIQQLRQGIRLSDGITAPAKVKILPKRDSKCLLEITIHEGRNRQVRRMMEAIGQEVLHLKRIAFAGLTLEGLKPGQWRYLNDEELEKLLASF